MKTQLFIPGRLKVGFNAREDTYTKKLAYVIYYDATGTLRKEKSWKSWSSASIPAEEYDNVPTEGFVLNKKVGGYKSDWNFRQSAVRIYDPRGFEFEISVPNLLFILEHCSSLKGKGLKGKFVYSWEGTELVLLPVESQDYKECQTFSVLQGQKIGSKDLVAGATYLTKKQEQLIFIGHLPYFDLPGGRYAHGYGEGTGTKKKLYIFQSPENTSDRFTTLTSVASLGGVVNDTPVEDYAFRLEKYLHSFHGNAIGRLLGTPVPLPLPEKIVMERGTGFYGHPDLPRNLFIEHGDGKFEVVYTNQNTNLNYETRQYTYTMEYLGFGEIISLKNGLLDRTQKKTVKVPIRNTWGRDSEKCEVVKEKISPEDPRLCHLTVQMTNGKLYQYQNNGLVAVKEQDANTQQRTDSGRDDEGSDSISAGEESGDSYPREVAVSDLHDVLAQREPASG